MKSNNIIHGTSNKSFSTTKSRPSINRFYRQNKVNGQRKSRAKKEIEKSIPPSACKSDEEKYEVIHTRTITKTNYTPFRGNDLDKILDVGSIAYTIRDNESFTKRVVYEVTPELLKNVIFDDLSSRTNDCYVVRVDKEGEVSPYFLPDFADLALYPLPLKIALRHMIMSSNNIPAAVKGVWESCGPSLPKVRPSCIIDSSSVESWKCYSNASKMQLVTVARAGWKNIFLSVECMNVSPNILDGRKYSCMFVVSSDQPVLKYCYSYNDATVLLWNCQGVGRPSFVSNFTELQKQHRPDIVVLLEIRCLMMELRTKLLEFKVHKL